MPGLFPICERLDGEHYLASTTDPRFQDAGCSRCLHSRPAAGAIKVWTIVARYTQDEAFSDQFELLASPVTRRRTAAAGVEARVPVARL